MAQVNFADIRALETDPRLAQLCRLSEELSEASDEDVHVIAAILDTFSNIDITYNLLVASQAGRALQQLKDHPKKEIRAMVKKLREHWKYVAQMEKAELATAVSLPEQCREPLVSGDDAALRMRTSKRNWIKGWDRKVKVGASKVIRKMMKVVTSPDAKAFGVASVVSLGLLGILKVNHKLR
eukprot:gnl/MRDRNA2_/MRDRNA2_292599_c0_seq1.p1 gnl/MRDRNA2_/MRDRNA2_292599_c0~~gnl/MRDRNA2_/MRDRNA2_292599_c0_seq1.p1  ORF type:complete len:203 (-),score=38.89 gnl/MRDRNA2_/MRDRNA2_292599_c0_seq1:86-631(-)